MKFYTTPRGTILEHGIMQSNLRSRVAGESIIAGRPWFYRALGLAGVLLLLGVLTALSGCADAVDNPEDCTSVEYFSEATKLCTACPAAIEPKCEPGCGFEIVRDENSCAVAECASECRCEEGEFFSDDNLSCVACSEAPVDLLICAE